MAMDPILVVDDEPTVRSTLCEAIQQIGYRAESVSSGDEALERCARHPFSLMISDVRMPDMNGMELLDRIKTRSPRMPVILMTGYGSVNDAVEAMQKGAADYLMKPFSNQALAHAIQKVDPQDPVRSIDLQTPARHPVRQNPRKIITRDPKLMQSLEIARNVAASRATVLIQGESGTGKEMLAQFIHCHCGAPDAPYVAVNCAALPDTLAESELFGHEKGAFTGAVGQRAGKFELAGSGTVVLDEISEMSMTLQAKLLRVLQERVVDRIGGSQPVKVQARVVAISNVDLKSAVADGKFRKDLYYRVHVIPLWIPPLRERKADIPLLAAHFLEKYARIHDRRPSGLSEAAMNRLFEYQWPGNVRELENAIERALLIHGGKRIDPPDLILETDFDSPPAPRQPAIDIQAGITVKDVEKALIFKTLHAVNDNRTHAAEMLGISIRTLRNKLREYQAEPSDRRPEYERQSRAERPGRERRFGG